MHHTIQLVIGIIRVGAIVKLAICLSTAAARVHLKLRVDDDRQLRLWQLIIHHPPRLRRLSTLLLPIHQVVISIPIPSRQHELSLGWLRCLLWTTVPLRTQGVSGAIAPRLRPLGLRLLRTLTDFIAVV